MKITLIISDEDANAVLEKFFNPQQKLSRREIVWKAATALYTSGKKEFSAADIYHKATELFGQNVNQASISLAVIACAPNHPSYDHGTIGADFLHYIKRSTYTLSEDALVTFLIDEEENDIDTPDNKQ